MASQNPILGIEETFGNYFNNWLSCKQTLLDQLRVATKPENSHNTDQQQNLIDQTFAHYRNYFEEKSKSAKQDVFLFLSPTWFTSFEKTLIWLGEFKPSVIFRLLDRSVRDLTEEQSARIERVKLETGRQERELTETMATIQESLAAPPIWNLMMRTGTLVDGELSEFDEAMETMKEAMLAVLEGADGLRLSTTANVMEVLSPFQTLVFLAAAIEFQLRVRRWGLRLRRDASGANGEAQFIGGREGET